jgi:hypothetical protein
MQELEKLANIESRLALSAIVNSEVDRSQAFSLLISRSLDFRPSQYGEHLAAHRSGCLVIVQEFGHPRQKGHGVQMIKQMAGKTTDQEKALDACVRRSTAI